MMYKIYFIDHLVETFFSNFNRHYADAMAADFSNLSLQEQVAYVKLLYKVRTYKYGNTLTFFVESSFCDLVSLGSST